MRNEKLMLWGFCLLVTIIFPDKDKTDNWLFTLLFVHIQCWRQETIMGLSFLICYSIHKMGMGIIGLMCVHEWSCSRAPTRPFKRILRFYHNAHKVVPCVLLTPHQTKLQLIFPLDVWRGKKVENIKRQREVGKQTSKPKKKMLHMYVCCSPNKFAHMPTVRALGLFALSTAGVRRAFCCHHPNTVKQNQRRINVLSRLNRKKRKEGWGISLRLLQLTKTFSYLSFSF